MSKKQRVSFHTLGCRLNQAETSTIAKSFLAKNYQIVPFNETSDVCVINTCTVTEHSDSKNRQIIRAIHRKNQRTCIAVIGCYSQMAADRIKTLDGVKLIVGNAEKLNLVGFVEAARTLGEPLIINPKISKKNFREPIFHERDFTTRSHLKIQDGCDFMCSFCVIPFSRGRSRSREFINLIEEAKSFVRAGAKEIVLTGVNIGTYADKQKTLIHVIDALNALSGLKRIRISSIEPTTSSVEIYHRMKDPSHKLVPFLHLPLQSGANTILTSMKRRYRREEYMEEIMEAYQEVQDLCIGTDVMVGFPGESVEDFDQTYQFLDSLPFTYFHVFPFSERKGTPAANLSSKIHPKEKKRRGELLRKLSLQKRNSFNQKYIGTVQSVLFESPNASSEISGYTDNYIKVRLLEIPQTNLKNKILPVHCIENCEEIITGKLVTVI